MNDDHGWIFDRGGGMSFDGLWMHLVWAIPLNPGTTVA
jgi:hypothetical protein